MDEYMKISRGGSGRSACAASDGWLWLDHHRLKFYDVEVSGAWRTPISKNFVTVGGNL